MESKPARRRSERPVRCSGRPKRTSRGLVRTGVPLRGGGSGEAELRPTAASAGVHPWRLGARSRRASSGGVEPTREASSPRGNPEAREKKSPDPPIDAKASVPCRRAAPRVSYRFLEFFTVRKFCHISLEVSHRQA